MLGILCTGPIMVCHSRAVAVCRVGMMMVL